MLGINFKMIVFANFNKFLKIMTRLIQLKDIAKTALLLEESIPNLRIFGIDYESAMQSLRREIKLLENERVVIDAKGFAIFFFFFD